MTKQTIQNDQGRSKDFLGLGRHKKMCPSYKKIFVFTRKTSIKLYLEKHFKLNNLKTRNREKETKNSGLQVDGL